MNRSIGIVIALFFCVMLFATCEADDTVADLSTTATLSAPATTPTSKNQVVLVQTAISGISLGKTSKDQIEQQLKSIGQELLGDEANHWRPYEVLPGIEGVYGSTGSLSFFMDNAGNLIRVATSGKEFPTDLNAKNGDSIEKVISIYGDDFDELRASETSYYIEYEIDTNFIAFYFNPRLKIQLPPHR